MDDHAVALGGGGFAACRRRPHELTDALTARAWSSASEASRDTGAPLQPGAARAPRAREAPPPAPGPAGP